MNVRIKKTIAIMAFAALTLCPALATAQALPGTSQVGVSKNKIVINDKMKFSEDSVIVKMKNLTFNENEVKKYFSDVAIESVSLLEYGNSSKTFKLALKKKGREDVLKAIDTINSKSEVLYAEPNYQFASMMTPNDKDYNNCQKNIMECISANKAWDLTTGNPNIVIGVIDNGIGTLNSDLKPNLWKNPGEIISNGIDDDNNGYVDDIYGYNFDDNNNYTEGDGNDHGTHVAGLIAAQGNNYDQIAGVTWQCKVASLKIIGASWHTGEVDGMIAAIKYATKMKFPILNISMGTYGYSQALYDVIKDYPGLVVASAGNDYSNNDKYPSYPASFDLDNIISVGATISDTGDKADFSNYGSTTVDLMAPGAKIIYTTGTRDTDSDSGTSMSAPMVSGAAALLMSYRPTYTVANIKKALLSNVDVFSQLSGKCATAGRLNIYKALTTPLPDTTPPSASMLWLFNNSNPSTFVTTNHQGEYWTKYSTVKAYLYDVKDPSGVQGVKFYLTYYTYPNSYSTKVISGKKDSNSNAWYADIPVSDNNIEVQAFPVDNMGNTLFDSMKGNSSYKFTKSFWYDTSKPDGYTYIEPQGSYWVDSSNRYVTNAQQINLRVHAHDYDGAPWISSSIKSIILHIYKNGSTTSTDYTPTYISGNADRYGDYVYTFNAPSETGENSYKVVADITDYAGNVFSANPQYFVTDTQSPRGYVTTPSSTIYGDSYEVYVNNVTEASYVTRVLFPTWTDANGQDDIIWYEGYRVNDTTWKITIPRSNHKNEKGLYYTHVYTEDYFGNLGMVGAVSVVLN